jgi:hypothetical protein
MRMIVYAERQLVKRHRGTMPILLTAAHGGSGEPVGVARRERGQTPHGCDFQDKRDNETALITEAVAQRILDNTGLSPYVVIAQYHRKYIDANRSEACAFTDANAQPFYHEYHDCIAGYAGQILGQNGGRGFLFDIHGTQVIAADPADIYLGTANGASLPAGFDRRNLFMQHGLHGLLKAARRQLDGGAEPPFQYRISPADEHTPETGAVSGGFTIKHYGAIINSIQIETADTLRADPALRAFFVDDLASALVNFARRYAPF